MKTAIGSLAVRLSEIGAVRVGLIVRLGVDAEPGVFMLTFDLELVAIKQAGVRSSAESAVHGHGSRAARALVALAVLLGGPVLPLLGSALADERAPLCCGRGRCCCAGATAGLGDRPCLLRACGCQHHQGATGTSEPPRIEAVLPARTLPAVPGPGLLSRARADATPVRRTHAPPVPPPRRPLPA